MKYTNIAWQVWENPFIWVGLCHHKKSTTHCMEKMHMLTVTENTNMWEFRNFVGGFSVVALSIIKLLLQITSWASHNFWPLLLRRCWKLALADMQLAITQKIVLCMQHHVRVLPCIACSIYISVITELIGGSYQQSQKFFLSYTLIRSNLKGKPNNTLLK